MNLSILYPLPQYKMYYHTKKEPKVKLSILFHNLCPSCLILIMFIVRISSVNTAPNSVDMNIDDMDAALRERGYPQLYLDNTAPSAKESLYNQPDLIFDGGQIAIYDEDMQELETYDLSNSGISPIGQIPDADLTVTLSFSRNKTSKNVLVTCSYNWKKIPTSRFQDVLAVSWDNTKYSMMSGGFYKVDKYDGINSGGKYVSGQVKSEARNYATGSNCGVSWYADLKGYTGFSAKALYGHGEFWLVPKSTNVGKSTFYWHYVHSKVSLGLSVTIPAVGSFSVSGAGSYDEMGNQKSYIY